MYADLGIHDTHPLMFPFLFVSLLSFSLLLFSLYTRRRRQQQLCHHHSPPLLTDIVRTINSNDHTTSIQNVKPNVSNPNNSLLLEILPALYEDNQAAKKSESTVTGDEECVKKKKKKRGKKKRSDSDDLSKTQVVIKEGLTEGIGKEKENQDLVCLYPFTSSSSATQRKIKQQYDQLVKSHESDGLTLLQGLQMSLPDELWRWILELGVETSSLTYKDICCLSMTSKRLNRLSKEDIIWSKLLSSDFPTHPSSSTSTPPKSIYQTRFEKDKAKKLLAEKRAVLRLESQIHEHKRKVHEIEHQLGEENERIKSAIDELKNLQKVKEASTALKVWQPAIVHGRQREIVENCSVPVDSRINVLEMEIKLCRQQIFGFLKARRDENGRLEVVREKLSKVKHRSFQSLESGSRSNGGDELKKCRKKSKKLKIAE